MKLRILQKTGGKMGRRSPYIDINDKKFYVKVKSGNKYVVDWGKVKWLNLFL